LERSLKFQKFLCSGNPYMALIGVTSFQEVPWGGPKSTHGC